MTNFFSPALFGYYPSPAAPFTQSNSRDLLHFPGLFFTHRVTLPPRCPYQRLTFGKSILLNEFAAPMPAKQSQSATTKRTHPSGQPELQNKPNSWRPNEPTAVRSVRRALQNKPNLVTERNLHERHLAAALIPGDEKRSAPRRCLATRKNEPTVETGQNKTKPLLPAVGLFSEGPNRRPSRSCGRNFHRSRAVTKRTQHSSYPVDLQSPCRQRCLVFQSRRRRAGWRSACPSAC